MTSLIARVFPGVALSIAAALGLSWLHAQPATTQIATPAPMIQRTVSINQSQAPAPQVIYVDANGRVIESAAAPVAPRQVIICGNCGAEIAAPQQVLVAQPVGIPPGSFYGMPPVGFAGYRGAYYDDDCYRPGAPPQPLLPMALNWNVGPHRPAPHRGGYRY